MANYFNIPRPPKISFNPDTQETQYDQVYLDPRTLEYKTFGQSQKIRQLEEELEKKETEKKLKVDNLIAYYYQK
jgi:hypothetical protein